MLYSMPFKICIAYGFINFCTSLIHNIFIVYHIQVFVSSFGLSMFPFWLSEIVFLIWNSVNDTLFGYLIDKHLFDNKAIDRAIIYRRARIISYCGPFFAFAFLATWFPHWLPDYPGLRFVIVLCSYDTVVTLLDLMKGALLADLAVSQNDRSRLGRSASIGQALSATGLMLISWWFDSGTDAYLLENPLNNINSDPKVHTISHEFQALAFSLSMFSAVGLFFSGKWVADMALRRSISSSSGDYVDEQISQNEFKQDSIGSEVNGVQHMLISLLHIVLRPNFFIFSLMQALQVFHCHFNSNFFPLFSKTLLGPGQESLFCAILGISFVLPHINNVFLLKASEKYGTYAVIRGLFCAKVVLGVILSFSGASNFVILSLFLASNRIFTEGICKLLSQVVSDLVDEDFVLSHRSQPVSAVIFGATSLLSRPGQSFAPLVGYALLSFLTGSSENPEVDASTETLRGACFTLAWSLVMFVGLAQLAIWSRFGLHGGYLARIKKERITIMDHQPSPSHPIPSSLAYSNGGQFIAASRVIGI